MLALHSLAPFIETSEESGKNAASIRGVVTTHPFIPNNQEKIPMKKQLLAVAVASAFATTAFAANVTVYGTVDTGLVYNNTSFGGAGPTNADVNKFSMDSGVLSGSKFGFKGSEDLGNGYSVSFQLENGFDSDTGKFGQSMSDGSNRMFGREARLSLNTPYGTVSFGRMGALTSGAGSYDIFQAIGDSLDGGNSDYIGTGYWFDRTRYDNMITLVTPEANGFQGYAQYSFQQEGAEKANERANTRYAALGLTYKTGALEAVVVADTVLRTSAAEKAYSDAQAFSFGVNYDFGVTKAFFGAQYGNHEKISFDFSYDQSVTDTPDIVDGYTDYFKGYNLHIGAATPLPCGTLTVSAYYGDYEAEDDNSLTAKKYGIGLMHEYALSKRTTFYTGAGFAQTELKGDDEAARIKGVNVTLGLNHKF